MSFTWVKAFDAAHSVEANIVKGMLEHAGIQCQLKGEALQGALGEIPFIEASVSVWVYNIKLPAAQEILLEYRQSKSSAQKWQCDSCKQWNPATFDLCWSCMKEHDEQA
ncbi:putative signal transducing protein [Pseudoalteromonas pernae]|uniref:putative signal transducing protein n=1 Tax=Pseudoalteromonas pernae TaxID=3118054 RepID=UPI003242130B